MSYFLYSRTLLIAFSLLFYSAGAQADPVKLKALVVYTEEAKAIINGGEYSSDGIVDQTGHADAVASGINEVFENSDLDDIVEYEVVDLQTIDLDEDDYVEVMGDMAAAMNGSPEDFSNSDGKTVEEMMKSKSADIVVLVVNNDSYCLSNPNCGGEVDDVLANAGGDPGNYTIVVIVDDITGRVTIHEIGHLAGARHDEDPGTPIEDDDMRGYEGSTHQTVMGNDPSKSTLPVFSKSGGTFTENGTSHTIGDNDADAQTGLEVMLPKVADYAEVRGPGMSPAIPNETNYFSHCIFKKAMFEFTWHTGSTTVPTSSYEIQRQTSSGGWNPYYSGGADCQVTQGSPDGVNFRLRGWNSNGESDWAYVVLQSTICLTGGGGGGN